MLGFLGILNGKLIEVIGRTVGGWLSLRMILFSFFLTKGSLELSYHGHLCMVNPFMLACVRRALPPPLSLEDLHPRGLHRQGSAALQQSCTLDAMRLANAPPRRARERAIELVNEVHSLGPMTGAGDFCERFGRKSSWAKHGRIPLLVITSASLVVTSALLVVTRSY